jgi:uncharacterized protein YbcI
MTDQDDAQTVTEPPHDLSDEIGSSLASVWARYVGARPSEAVTQLEGSAIRWVLSNGTSEFEAGMSAEAAEGEPPRERRTVAGYKRETSAVVAKLTHRPVVAMISDHNAKTGVATETFILDVLRPSN